MKHLKSRLASAQWANLLWHWGVPSIALLLLTLLWLFNQNQHLFFTINGFGQLFDAKYWSYITIFGDVSVIAALVLIFIYIKPELIWTSLIAGLISSLLTQGIKWSLQWPRPGLVIDPENFQLIGSALSSSPAFPSGHTAVAILLASIVCLYWRRVWVFFIIFGFALLVGISRIAIGVHWPADVLGGIVVGWTSAVLGFYFTAHFSNPNHWITKIIVVILFINAINLIIFYDTNYDHTRVLQAIIGLTCVIIAALRVRSLLLSTPLKTTK